MDKTERDDAEEIFQDCDNGNATKTACDLNREYKNFGPEKGYKETKNNQHVVHAGVIIVILTIYLGLTNVPKCLVNCVENSSVIEKVQGHMQQTEKLQNTQVLERLLEYKDICKDLEIFTKDIKQQQQLRSNNNIEAEKEEANGDNEHKMNNNMSDNEVSSGAMEEESSVEQEDSSGSSGSGDCIKKNHNNNKKSKYSIKTSNNKNGFNKYNKSTKAKDQKTPKKDSNLNKKNSTAEPIIYLFALVFIYLLLKAASDINQHYKSKNKNDKRLRRCSLQSYAQTHRPDRRASKVTTELVMKQKQQHQLQISLKSLSRCSSQDQPSYHYRHHHQQQVQQHLTDGLPQKSSEQKQQTNPGTPVVRSNVSYSSNWQLLRQHTTTQSLDNSDILNSSRGNAEISTSRMARRCSVPAALSFQRQKFSTPSPLSIVNDPVNLNVSLSRRSSIVSSSLPIALDPNESLTLETKRRVRMINRH